MRVRAGLGLALAAVTVAACSSVTPPPPPESSTSASATSATRTTTSDTPTTGRSSAPSSTDEESSSPAGTTRPPSTTASPSPTEEPLDPTIEAWFTADCTAQVELRRLSQVSLGSTPEQQRESVQQIYTQHAAFDLATKDILTALDPPNVPGGAEIKKSRIAEFTALHEQYTAGLEALTTANPMTTDELSAVIEQVEAAVYDAIAAVPQPTETLPATLAARIADLPACRPGALLPSTPSSPSSSAGTTATTPTAPSTDTTD